MSDLARTIAFAYRRKGLDVMAGTELRLLLAYDLRWFAPEDAKRVVQRALDAGLLLPQGDALRPAFDVAAVDIPLNFRPGTHVLEEEIGALPAPPAPVPPPQPQPDAVVERAAEEERRRRGLLLGLDAARLIVRRRAGEDVTGEAAQLEAGLLSAAARPRP